MQNRVQQAVAGTFLNLLKAPPTALIYWQVLVPGLSAMAYLPLWKPGSGPAAARQQGSVRDNISTADSYSQPLAT